MDPLSNGTGLLAAWWGYAEADATIVGVLVGAIGALAVTYVVLRLRKARAGSSRSGSNRS